ncbi:MAG: response regulator transcription factor [Gammaproteobacteria bacterium]|nr:response regulator transcription factor [Gammaproteobacteria bacterium]MDH3409278.1 response regulator transcription factor [Gammaproteobacteria bacterium]
MTRNNASLDGPLRRHNGCSTIAVSIASGRRALAAALLASLECEQDFKITGRPIRKPVRLLSCLEQRGANLLLVDKRLLDRLDGRSTRTIHAKFPDLRVLILCDREQSGLLQEIVNNRFHGFMLISHAADTCAKAIRTVSRGGLWLPRAWLEKAILGPAQAADRDKLRLVVEPDLTRRESQAVAYLREGLTNKQIASKLGIKEDTVKKHLHNVYGKLGIRRRTQLIAHNPIRH